jgi:hypothetical protein
MMQTLRFCAENAVSAPEAFFDVINVQYEQWEKATVDYRVDYLQKCMRAYRGVSFENLIKDEKIIREPLVYTICSFSDDLTAYWSDVLFIQIAYGLIADVTMSASAVSSVFWTSKVPPTPSRFEYEEHWALLMSDNGADAQTFLEVGPAEEIQLPCCSDDSLLALNSGQRALLYLPLVNPQDIPAQVYSSYQELPPRMGKYLNLLTAYANVLSASGERQMVFQMPD